MRRRWSETKRFCRSCNSRLDSTASFMLTQVAVATSLQQHDERTSKTWMPLFRFYQSGTSQAQTVDFNASTECPQSFSQVIALASKLGGVGNRIQGAAGTIQPLVGRFARRAHH